MITEKTFECAEKIANSILYDSTLPSPRQPTIAQTHPGLLVGSIFPLAYTTGQTGIESSYTQTELLVKGSPQTTLDIRVRFLQLLQRDVGAWSDDPTLDYCKVETLRVGDQVYHSWRQALERQFDCENSPLHLPSQQFVFSYPAQLTTETLQDPSGKTVGVLIRRHEALAGIIKVITKSLGSDLFKVTLQIKNRTPLHAPSQKVNDILMHTFISTHAILRVSGGEFASLINPSSEYRGATALRQNIGTFPVLIGEPNDHSMMLSSPIVLYDYPHLAAPNADHPFDGNGRAEFLSLPFTPPTDEEESTMRQSRKRARVMADRMDSRSLVFKPSQRTTRGLVSATDKP